ncbi:ectoine/hydroxyectoine ABC transporter substrate-binding protein EhuB [Thermomonospora catenispora]|uniref:ectoine/hydroxyectoine ABC transporter substrate-binding protein EhuB n=1 Tax=Thermomonospora catenispora TaxID=2493090 RepID=UPI00111EA6B5|nr:ectoine/hydroxyectoine ABC transporter substrate-binding protein EhuB [Thermomonospora catenispora]TNY38147.1 ectoine/hydroxyectoine ABC transporter substrate-binding protein EhuB [Thermomonospora catenispora]
MTSPMSRRDLLRRSGLAAAAIIGGPALLSACSKAEDPATSAGGALERVKAAGKIKVGFANEAPYGFRDKNGRLTGEAPEVAREIFKALGVNELEPVLVDSFGALIPGLNAGNYDVIAAGMSITPERCGQIAFSDPDYAGTTALLVKQGNPKGLKTFAEIAADSGVKVAVLEGAVEKGYAEAYGVKSGQIQVYPDANAAFQGLLDGRVDAVALTSITLNWNKRQHYADAPIEVTPSFVPVIDGKEEVGAGGYGFRKADTELREAFNAELKKLQDSGRLLEIVKPFGFTAAEIDAAKKLTADQLCKPTS